MKNKIIYEKQCWGCKIISGTFFAVLTAWNASRVRSFWHRLPTNYKAYNALGFTVMGGLSLLNFWAAKQIIFGKHMMGGDQFELPQYRQGYKERLTAAYEFHRMSDDQKSQFIADKLKLEEEKLRIERHVAGMAKESSESKQN